MSKPETIDDLLVDVRRWEKNAQEFKNLKTGDYCCDLLTGIGLARLLNSIAARLELIKERVTYSAPANPSPEGGGGQLPEVPLMRDARNRVRAICVEGRHKFCRQVVQQERLPHLRDFCAEGRRQREFRMGCACDERRSPSLRAPQPQPQQRGAVRYLGHEALPGARPQEDAPHTARSSSQGANR